MVPGGNEETLVNEYGFNVIFDISVVFGQRLAELPLVIFNSVRVLVPLGVSAKKYAWVEQTLRWRSVSKVAGQPSESVRPIEECPWLNNNKTFPLPNRRDTIRNGRIALEVWPQAKTFLARFTGESLTRLF